MDALSKQTDVGEISRKLQLKDVVASTLNASELETIKQSMLKMVKYMLVDLAPPVFLESALVRILRLCIHHQRGADDSRQL